MENTEILIARVLNSRPHQLPPIFKEGGTYTLDVRYLGKQFLKVGTSLNEVLEAYLKFVYDVDGPAHPERMANLPRPQGYLLRGKYKNI